MGDGAGYLVICATPIGNLSDASPRLSAALGDVDVIYAEDTRRTAKLLSHLGLVVPTRSLFTGNESSRSVELVDEVSSGKAVALVSDAGMPVISDPGFDAVRRVREEGLEVRIVPGPSAVTSAMAISGFPGDRFCFEGFLPRSGSERSRRIAGISRDDRPTVMFASPKRLVADLEDLAAAAGTDRQVAICRELTKIHEETWVGTLGEAIDYWGSAPIRGEVTLVLGPGSEAPVTLDAALDDARRLVASGSSVSSAARQIADVTGISRREIYGKLLESQERS